MRPTPLRAGRPTAGSCVALAFAAALATEAGCSPDYKGTPPFVAEGSDAGASDGAPDRLVPDDAGATGRCDRTKPFEPGVPLADLSPPDDPSSEPSVFLSADELTAYLASERPGGLGKTDLYVATRAQRDLPFGKPVPLPGAVNGAVDERHATLPDDELSLYFERSGAWFRATRATPTAAFGAPTALLAGQLVFSPYVAASGKSAYFTHLRGDGGSTFVLFQYDFAQARLSELPGLTALSFGANPVVIANERELYFRGSGGILRTVFDEPSRTWSQPASAAVGQTGLTNAPTFVTRDGCLLYYSVEKPLGTGSNYKLFVARRPR